MTKIPLTPFLLFVGIILFAFILIDPVITEVKTCRSIAIHQQESLLARIHPEKLSKEQIIEAHNALVTDSKTCVRNVPQKTGRSKVLVDFIADLVYTGCELPPIAIIEVQSQ